MDPLLGNFHKESIMGEPLPTPSDSFLSQEEDGILLENRRLRQALIRLLAQDANGTVRLPEPTSEKLMLTQLMGDVDKEVITRAKLRAANKSADAVANAAGAVAHLLKGYKVGQYQSRPEERILPAEVSDVEVVPGEMETGVVSFNMDDIYKA